MSQNRFGLAMVLMLVFAFLIATPRPQVARAAGPFVVNTTRDLQGNSCGSDAQYPNLCSFRQALNEAINAGGNSEIQFNIPTDDNAGPSAMPGFDITTSTWTIKLGLVDSNLPVNIDEPLPIITKDDIYINGGSQATYSGLNISGPLVFIDGSDVMSQGGISVSNASQTRIHRLGIINFLGSSSPGDLQGVGIELFAATNSEIRGCYIGVNQAGTGAAPNDAAGILIQSGSGNIIGGNNSLNSEFNVISGNANDGIRIRQGSTGNNITGNRIGTNSNGTFAIPNGQHGVQLEINSSANQIGAPSDQPSNDSTLRNIIAGNNGYGVYINGTSNNIVNGNWIGANNLLNVRIPNKLGGVNIFSTNSSTSKGNTVGGNTASTRNIIAGNNGPGVTLTGPNTTENTVANNYIGIGFSTSVPVSNTIGVLLQGGGDKNIIGGNGISARNNVISGNSQDGVRISGVSNNTARDNIVSGNRIGVASSGTISRPNAGIGIALSDYVSGTRIGGTAEGAGNIIANNGGDGIVALGSSIDTLTITSNLIQENGQDGIRLAAGTRKVQIGGAEGARNTITENGGNGIQGTTVVDLAVQGNLIGTATVTESAELGNIGNGISLSNGSTAITITDNVLFDNAAGVQLASSSFAKIDNNTVNENRGDGIRLLGSTTISVTNNSIISNTLVGVFVGEEGGFGPSQQVQITDNHISGNVVQGIDLVPETVGLPGNASNSNHDIDAPFNLRLNQAGQLTGRVYPTNQPAACRNCTIQIFTTNPETLDRQGLNKIDTPVELSTNGYFTATLGTSVTLGLVPQQIALTATDEQGSTSEFAAFTASITGGLDIEPPRSGTAAPGDVISYTHRITNNTTLDFTDLQIAAESDQGWEATVAPETIELAAGASAPVTVTITLPKSPNDTVLAGTVDQTRVTVASEAIPEATDAVTDTTTVLEAFKLEVDPLTSTAEAPPGQDGFHTHTLRNIGNLTGTVTISYETDLGWTTEVTPTELTLGPGEQLGISVVVTVPEDTAANTKATTIIGVQVTSPSGQPTIFATDTTIAALQAQATIVPNCEREVEAGQTTTCQHTVTNLSNGRATFRLQARPSGLGSTTTFRSATSGVTLGPDNTFTLNAGAQFTFFADISVPARVQAGSVDQITISLLDERGVTIGGVQDTIRVTANAFGPQRYLPLIQR